MGEDSSRAVAIVSGSATGIGAACALAFAQAGANVLVNYTRSERDALGVTRRCIAAGVDAIPVRADIAEDEACRVLAEQAVTRWGRIDVLVNNAGITRFADPHDLESLSRPDFEAVFAVNVTGAYQLTRAVERRLRESPVAAVVNVSSHSGFSGVGSSIAYAASKGALNTLTLSLARALAPAIRVNAVCPGFVDTRWMRARLDEAGLQAFKQRAAAIAPLQRMVQPEEVADAVTWLALRARAVTGQLLVVDNGTHLTVGDPL